MARATMTRSLYRRATGADGGTTISARAAGAAYAHLKERLLEGDLGQGDKLSVVDLTRQLGCSRVPVMEALKRLEGEGFVHIVPQVGCSVVTPSPADVEDFFSLFADVEARVARFAALRRSATDLEEFVRVCAHIDGALETAAGPGVNDPTYRRLNLLFHGCIHRMARSPVTTTIAADLWDRSDFYIKLAFGSLYFPRRVRDAHARLRRALIAGDAAAAGAAIAGQLEEVGTAVAAALARRVGDT